MAVPAVFVQSYAVVGSPALAEEAVVCQVGGVSSTLPGQAIKLHGWMNIEVGTDGTAVNLRIRKDSLIGTIVGAGISVQVDDTANADGFSCDVYVQDVDENVGGAIYVLTTQVSSASAASSVDAVFLEARID